MTAISFFRTFEHGFPKPERFNEGSIGLDVCYAGDLELTIPPLLGNLIPTGWGWECKRQNIYLRIAPRSGLALRGIGVLAGVVDPDYSGEIKVMLWNHGPNPYRIKPGDRIAQLIPEMALLCNPTEVECAPGTSRGGGL